MHKVTSTHGPGSTKSKVSSKVGPGVLPPGQQVSKSLLLFPAPSRASWGPGAGNNNMSGEGARGAPATSPV